jgi:AmiR/NasT family two-component response regulator
VTSDQPDPERERLIEELDRARAEVEGLQAALASRHMIGMAQGILMLRYGVDETKAFAFLSRTSQQENVKLREVAQRIVQQVGSEGVGPGRGARDRRDG